MFLPRSSLPGPVDRRLLRAAVCLSLLLLVFASPAFARDTATAPPGIPTNALVLRSIGGGGRSPFFRDALVAQIVAGKWTAPKAGDTVDLPGGSKRMWEKLEVAKDGAF